MTLRTWSRERNLDALGLAICYLGAVIRQFSNPLSFGFLGENLINFEVSLAVFLHKEIKTVLINS